MTGQGERMTAAEMQRESALMLANDVRYAQSRLLAEVRDPTPGGSASRAHKSQAACALVSDFLRHGSGHQARIRVVRLLWATPGLPKRTTQRLLAEAGVYGSPEKRVCDLTARQRLELARLLSEWAAERPVPATPASSPVNQGDAR